MSIVTADALVLPPAATSLTLIAERIASGAYADALVAP